MNESRNKDRQEWSEEYVEQTEEEERTKVRKDEMQRRKAM